MPQLICDTCGRTIEYNEGDIVAECSYCGMSYPTPGHEAEAKSYINSFDSTSVTDKTDPGFDGTVRAYDYEYKLPSYTPHETFAPPEREEKGSSAAKVLIIVLIFIMLIIILIGSVFILTKTKDNTSEEENISFSDDIDVGDSLSFGSYEQDDDTSNGKEPISWIVLDKKDSYMILMTKKCIDCVKFNKSAENTNWESCSLRAWLNEDFYNEAFSEGEKKVILETQLSTNNNSDYGTYSGGDTTNMVYILSMNEVSKYLDSKSARKAKPTSYSEESGIWVDSSTGNSWWWLRTSGGNNKYAACVDHTGKISSDGSKVSTSDNGVRPVICVEY